MLGKLANKFGQHGIARRLFIVAPLRLGGRWVWMSPNSCTIPYSQQNNMASLTKGARTSHALNPAPSEEDPTPLDVKVQWPSGRARTTEFRGSRARQHKRTQGEVV